MPVSAIGFRSSWSAAARWYGSASKGIAQPTRKRALGAFHRRPRTIRNKAEARVGIASVLLESIVIAVSSNPEADRARELGWNNEDRNLAIEYRWTEGM
jgi:hypothetical protein